MYICSLLYVGMLAIWDAREKMIPAIALCIGGMLGVTCAAYTVLFGERNVWDIGMAMLPGIVLLLLAYATRQQIGYGDGLLLLILGLFLEKEMILFIVVSGQLMASFWGIVLLVFRKAGKGTTIPYIPFLFMAMLLYQVVIV